MTSYTGLTKHTIRYQNGETEEMYVAPAEPGFIRVSRESDVSKRYYTRAVRVGDHYKALVREVDTHRVIEEVTAGRADMAENEAAALAGVPWKPAEGWDAYNATVKGDIRR